MWRAILLAVVILVGRPALAGDEAPAARQWLTELQQDLAVMQRDLPAITAAAEAAAPTLIGGAGLGVRGDAGLAMELAQQPGAMWAYSAGPGRDSDVLLVVQLDGSLTLQLQGRSLQLHRSRADRSPGLDGVLRSAAAWAWQAEVFAACTRLGRTPVVHKSLDLDTRRDRLIRYAGQRLHDDRWVESIPPHVLGRRYLARLGEVLRDIGTASWDELGEAAARVRVARQHGGTAWLRVGGAAAWHVGGRVPRDPQTLTPLLRDLEEPGAALGPADVVVAIGASGQVGSDWWGRVEVLRTAGHGVIWIVDAAHSHRRDLRRGEVLLDLWSPLGDAAVAVPGYDARLGPVSGVTSEAVYWMISVEAAASR